MSGNDLGRHRVILPVNTALGLQLMEGCLEKDALRIMRGSIQPFALSANECASPLTTHFAEDDIKSANTGMFRATLQA
jgi:hypothetical protein